MEDGDSLHNGEGMESTPEWSRKRSQAATSFYLGWYVIAMWITVLLGLCFMNMDYAWMSAEFLLMLGLIAVGFRERHLLRRDGHNTKGVNVLIGFSIAGALFPIIAQALIFTSFSFIVGMAAFLTAPVLSIIAIVKGARSRELPHGKTGMVVGIVSLSLLVVGVLFLILIAVGLSHTA